MNRKEAEMIQDEILEILKENGYRPGMITKDTFIYENIKNQQVVIERPNENSKIEDSNHFRPHSEYIIAFFDSVEQCNKMLERWLK